MVSSVQSQLISALTAPAPDVGTSVAKKTLDMARQEGADMVSLIDASNPESSSLAGDPLVAKATGLGGQLDVVA